MADRSLIEFLQDPGSYPEKPSGVTLVQTHISWVFIGDDLVYKVKKPVDFGFLDFTTLDKRRFYTGEELRLNRRFSPDVYLDVVPISERNGTFRFGDTTNIVEYALKMRRISEDHMLYRLLEKGSAGEDVLRQVGAHLARVYGTIASDETARPFGGIEVVSHNIVENFEQTEKYVGGPVSRDAFEAIRNWSMDVLRDRIGIFEERVARGLIKECHGDLHLQHICVDGDNISVFDCIEFNERFRYGDVASDVAFLAMDLDYNGYPGLAEAFVQAYMAESGDAGLPEVLTFYKVYRAYVRAKVTSFMLDDPGLGDAVKARALTTAGRYYALAREYVSREN
ncbi:MAG TPA: phosphotransferase [Deltaproteobacteria bacterium]|nr:phosphotransferase [Deltaproteobacteria bacterium]HPR53793.1 phosphotransferase [Deltaproteobacteria bacterium]HXK46007.1 phosphotransferase [Deltaproteobacteria bacterium]